jgi:hypothetical protein
MVPNKPDREVIKEHTIAGMNAAKKAIFAHPLPSKSSEARKLRLQ